MPDYDGDDKLHGYAPEEPANDAVPADGPPQNLKGTARQLRPSQYRPPQLSSPGQRTRTVTYEEQLENNRVRIARLYESGRIEVIDGREHFGPGAREEFDRLLEERNLLRSKVNPMVVPGFVGYEIHVNGVAYSFTPYAAWERLFMSAWTTTLPTPHGPHSTRDRLLWLMYHFRDRAIIQAGTTPRKVRGPFVECAACGFKHRYLSRPKNKSGLSVCRRCGDNRFRDISDQPILKPLEEITKTFLCRRFRVSRRVLDKVLAVPAPELS